MRATEHTTGFESLDLMGRAVTLAFRLSGVGADFPGIAAQRDIVEAVGNLHDFGFRKWKPTAGERLRFFNHEHWGTKSLFVSGAKKPRGRKLRLVE
jgi:hypothetical protein